jgi:hypothetical protein
MYALKHVRILHIINFLHLLSQYFCVGTHIVNVSQTFSYHLFFLGVLWMKISTICSQNERAIVKKKFIDIIFKPLKGECLLLMFVILSGCWQSILQPTLFILGYIVCPINAWWLYFIYVDYLSTIRPINKGLYLNHLLTLQHLLCVHQHLL